MTTTDWVQAVSMIVLVIVTGIYAWRTHVISKATKEQAEEMKEQRIMTSRPVIIQRAVYKEGTWTDEEIQFIGIEKSAGYYFSHFEVYNAGNGPAIEVEISLLNKEKILIVNEEMKPISWRDSFLRARESPIKFYSSELANLEESAFYLVTEYRSISPLGAEKIWYQTLLPFKTVKASKEGEIYVQDGEF